MTKLVTIRVDFLSLVFALCYFLRERYLSFLISFLAKQTKEGSISYRYIRHTVRSNLKVN